MATFCENTKYNTYLCEVIATYIEYYNELIQNSNNSNIIHLISEGRKHIINYNLFNLLQKKINEIRNNKRNNLETFFSQQIIKELCYNL